MSIHTTNWADSLLPPLPTAPQHGLPLSNQLTNRRVSCPPLSPQRCNMGCQIINMWNQKMELKSAELIMQTTVFKITTAVYIFKKNNRYWQNTILKYYILILYYHYLIMCFKVTKWGFTVYVCTRTYCDWKVVSHITISTEYRSL